MTNSPPVQIVIIEDEKQIRHFLYSALTADGFQVYEAENGQRGLIDCATRKPDLVILDLGLPDIDGISVIEQLRTWSQIPIIVLSARSQEAEKVAALDAGADDYLTKPFGLSELQARIRAHLRRQEPQQQTLDAHHIHFGDIAIDVSQRIVLRQQQAVHLTQIEYRLLLTLIRHAGKVMTHRQLLQAVWGPNHTESGHYLRIYMGHLRQKLEVTPAQPKHFLTETGVGYRFVL
ncbi:MAG: two-component system response regulator KdpE [Moraxellaceae bacterium]|nr:two-component system response regulator KdpE [Moraxellaceae bacterium]